MKAKSGFKVAGRLLLLLCCLYFFICSLSFLSDSFRMVGGRSLGGKYHQVADLSETVNINPGEQCKSLKSTSRLLDVGLDVESDGHLGISFLTSLNQQLFRNIAYVWYSWHFNKAVFLYLYLYLCICIFDSWEYQF